MTFTEYTGNRGPTDGPYRPGSDGPHDPERGGVTLTDDEVQEFAVTITALSAGRIDGRQAVSSIAAQAERILAARVAEVERERDAARIRAGQAEYLSNRNAEDAALWWAHYRRTYGEGTSSEQPPVWINADGTTSPVLPATTASAETVDWEAVATRMIGKVAEISQQKINAEAEVAALRKQVEAARALTRPGARAGTRNGFAYIWQQHLTEALDAEAVDRRG